MIKLEILANNLRIEVVKIKNYTIQAFLPLFNKIYLIILFVLNIFLWLGAFYIDSIIEKNIIALHYNVDFGINLIGETKNIYIIPVVGLLVIVINSILYINLSVNKDKKIIFHVLFATSLFVNIILLSAVTSVYLINFQ